ncbi:trypsin-like peptidase domain-containing protein [Bradyrhizobium japonicum]|uniref:trypsin-like peptidase domain-containing protein n=1 Tax=Bradyrhizobium japonicum TaxID=375 RepID=UPI001BA89850|nr:trypsin-like peptidase domain-containing protein [Bradyrhizobium japonicum]MBR0764423.1 trypsin-like peptidase domain-containing protein [Bradyrhizobium japonicum]
MAVTRAGKPITFGLCAAMLGASLALNGMGRALAAEVDAAGVNAPVGFAEVIDRVRPAVVGIRVKTDTGNVDAERTQPFPPGSLLDRFFRQFGVQIPPDPAPGSDVTVGSGFLISGDGYIVTNEHVVAKGIDIEVTMDDGRIHSAKLIGTDPQTDLALIRISAPGDLPYVRFAAAEPRIGEWVLAIGDPFGLGGSVTAGIVSARGRDIGGESYNDFIQIDAPVNKGNSGGPSFNVRGEVIGVNTVIYSPSGGSVGVAFDVPAETVRLVVRQLRDKGYVSRGWVGVYLQEITLGIADAMNLKSTRGALVAQLDEGPAAKQGVEPGDVITFVNDHELKNPRDFARTVAAITPGTVINLRLLRNAKEMSIGVMVGEASRALEASREKQPEPRERTELGLTTAPARLVSGAGDAGVVVLEIRPGSGAPGGGLQVGDIILAVGGQPVVAGADIDRMVNEARAQSRRTILVRIKRSGAMNFVAVPIT